ncbi:hypothetical protein T02_12725 [Trichinella nativa]|uniref:Uncharacterized protein n=1 Tax=Trichinella nativa TaxID=6335 RepID=A0A0V1LA79_9BILA|nr:hypothetical protein T02_12725 [Trichinella nativa]
MKLSDELNNWSVVESELHVQLGDSNVFLQFQKNSNDGQCQQLAWLYCSRQAEILSQLSGQMHAPDCSGLETFALCIYPRFHNSDLDFRSASLGTLLCTGILFHRHLCD